MLIFQKVPQNMRSAEVRYLVAFVLAGAVLICALFNVAVSVILAPLVARTAPMLASKRRGRFLLAVLCGLVVLCGLLPHFTGAAILLLLMVRQAVEERRYQADWA
jgi:uncharacterized membrane protein